MGIESCRGLRMLLDFLLLLLNENKKSFDDEQSRKRRTNTCKTLSFCCSSIKKQNKRNLSVSTFYPEECTLESWRSGEFAQADACWGCKADRVRQAPQSCKSTQGFDTQEARALFAAAGSRTYWLWPEARRRCEVQAGILSTIITTIVIFLRRVHWGKINSKICNNLYTDCLNTSWKEKKKSFLSTNLFEQIVSLTDELASVSNDSFFGFH